MQTAKLSRCIAVVSAIANVVTSIFCQKEAKKKKNNKFYRFQSRKLFNCSIFCAFFSGVEKTFCSRDTKLQFIFTHCFHSYPDLCVWFFFSVYFLFALPFNQRPILISLFALFDMCKYVHNKWTTQTMCSSFTNFSQTIQWHYDGIVWLKWNKYVMEAFHLVPAIVWDLKSIDPVCVWQ